MSDTPRTDAAAVSSEFIRREMDIYRHKFVLADHARDLERENERMETEIADLRRRLAEAERETLERAVKALSSMRWGLGFSYDRAYDDAISQGIDAIRALIPKEADREQN